MANSAETTEITTIATKIEAQTTRPLKLVRMVGYLKGILINKYLSTVMAKILKRSPTPEKDVTDKNTLQLVWYSLVIVKFPPTKDCVKCSVAN